MADPNASVTPEKKLLELIEGSPAASSADGTGGQRPERGFGRGPLGGGAFDLAALFSPPVLKAKLAGLAETVTGFFKGSRSTFDVKRVIAVVKACALILGIVLMLDLAYEFYLTASPFLEKLNAGQRKIAELPGDVTPLYSPGASLDEDQRNIFAPYGKKVEKKEGQEDLSLKLVEMTKQLRLTGISVNPVDPRRTSCMIEDLQKNMTSFLHVGDSIAGLKVEKISSDGVVLKYQEQEIEIK